MATFQEIKKAILDVAGNPESGAIAELADSFASAIVSLDLPVEDDQAKNRTALERPDKKETRVTKPTELR